MEALQHTPRAHLGPRLPRRRSKAQRNRHRGPSPVNSLSSSPEPVVWPRPQRKKRRRKRGEENTAIREEDLIDGFCISSFGSLEAMQRDVSVEPTHLEEPYKKRPPGKRKRSDGGSSEDPGVSESQREERPFNGQKRHCAGLGSPEACVRHSGPEHAAGQDCRHCCLDAGYICDAESSCDEQAPSDDLAVSFTISMTTCTSSDLWVWCAIASPQVSGGRPKLTVLSQISGLGRSCEKSQEPEIEMIPPPRCPSPIPPPASPPRATPKIEPVPAETPPTTSVEPRASSSHRSSVPKSVPTPVSRRTPTPSISLPVHTAPPTLPSMLRPPSHNHMNLFTPSQGLPPPPPLLQVSGHPPSAVLAEHNLIGQEMSSRFLAAPGGPAELGAAVRPMYQFHQHNHQHTHQHTHQHFTPYPHNFFPPFSPVITALPPVLPPSVSFGSLQGAFQPKSTSSELASQCSVPPNLTHKAPQITEQFKPRRSGRWCAMHVRVAYMILRHQERIKLDLNAECWRNHWNVNLITKLAQGAQHKPEFRSDLLCLSTGLGSLPSTHELSRPPTLMTGAVSHTPGQFQVASSAAQFLPHSGPVDPFIRAPGFSPLASLTNGAFGGLGNPTYNPSSVFSQKEASMVHNFPNPHDPWNRLHRTPPSFPVAPAQICGKVGDLDPHTVHMKDEKDRDLLYSRLPPRMSPLTQTPRLPGAEDRGPSRNLSPYVAVRPGSSSETKPRLTPDHPSKVKVKEEPELLSFEVGRSPLPGLHLPHPSPPFERLRGSFLGEQYPNALEAWRDVYRRADPPPLRLPSSAPQRLYEQREERAHILREDFERARLYGLPTHITMQPATQSMLGQLYHHHGTGLLSKTPPINLLSAPPPLISTSRPGSPHRRDLYKDRDCR
ncbi:probable fibrosin-1 isoform X3 [Aquarana catesbeiana]|uniref:probable fibrosin-1 isoform X3 n=1 Tax=Aquarana catesbeiana TaxID=8400 RepID=UPI003CC97986